MPSYARATIVGHACADPEIRDANGKRVANFTIAVNEPARAGEPEKPAAFYRVAAWERLADIAGRYIHRGDAVMVAGRLTMETYRTRDGQERSAPRVNASDIVLLSNRAETRPDTRPASPSPMDDQPDDLPF